MMLSTPLEKGFGSQLLDPSPVMVVVSVPPFLADEEGNRDFGAMPSGSCSRREQHRLLLSNIQGLVCRAGLHAPDDGLVVLCLMECDLSDCLTLMGLRLA